jgi:N-acetylglutamate synthase-like GNAT family acetyltransferase
MSTYLEIRRAKLRDLTAITSLAQQATQSGSQPDEAEIRNWLFSKGLWVALERDTLVGVAAWQAENLVSITDVFYVSPDRPWAEAASRLLETIESEANTLMCEINAIALPAGTSEAIHAFFQQHGYEFKKLEGLHRIWREVLDDFVHDGSELMVKRLRKRMVMIPP